MGERAGDRRCGTRPHGCETVACNLQRGHQGEHVWQSADGRIIWRWDGGDAPDAPKRVWSQPAPHRPAFQAPREPQRPVVSKRAARRAERDRERLMRRMTDA